MVVTNVTNRIACMVNYSKFFLVDLKIASKDEYTSLKNKQLSLLHGHIKCTWHSSFVRNHFALLQLITALHFPRSGRHK